MASGKDSLRLPPLEWQGANGKGSSIKNAAHSDAVFAAASTPAHGFLPEYSFAGVVPKPDIFMDVPAFVGFGFNGDGQANLALFDPDFALGLDLVGRFEALLLDSVFEGLEAELGASLDEQHARDMRRVELGNRIDALLCEAHTRGRWDLLDKAYPFIWDRFAVVDPLIDPPWALGAKPKVNPRPPKWNGFPDLLLKRRDEVRELVESGKALEDLLKRADERAVYGLPTPGWLAPFVNYVPKWWIVPQSKSKNPDPEQQSSNNALGSWLPFKPGQNALFELTYFPKRWRVRHPVRVPQPPEWNDYAVKIGIGLFASFALGQVLSGWSASIWESAGSPLGEFGLGVVEGGVTGSGSALVSGTNPLEGALNGMASGALSGAQEFAAGIDFTDELGALGGDIASGALSGAASSLVSGSSVGAAALGGALKAATDNAGDLVGVVGGSDHLSFVADLAAGNLSTSDILMNLSLDAVDGYLASANDFLDQVNGIKQQVSGLFNTPTAPPPFVPPGYPGPGPVYDPNEAGGGAVATPGQIEGWIKGPTIPPALILVGIAWFLLK